MGMRLNFHTYHKGLLFNRLCDVPWIFMLPDTTEYNLIGVDQNDQLILSFFVYRPALLWNSDFKILIKKFSLVFT